MNFPTHHAREGEGEVSEWLRNHLWGKGAANRNIRFRDHLSGQKILPCAHI
jgi:hypothetical protein